MSNSNQRRFLVGLGVLTGTIAVFASGFIVARALDDSETGQGSSGSSLKTEDPEAAPPIASGPTDGSGSSSADSISGTTGFGQTAPQPAVPNRGFGTDGDQAFSEPGFGYGGCPGPLTDLLVGNSLNLAGDRFSLVMLGEEFELSSLSISSFGPCDEGDAESLISSNSSWIHSDSGSQLWINQDEHPERSANVEYPGSLNFWNNGYRYSVNVNFARILTADGVTTDDALGSATGAVLDEGAVAALLDSVFATIAPNLDRACFYRQADGSWSDLAALGLGDPRGAIPTSFNEVGLQLTMLVTPPASCGEPLPSDGTNSYFNAQFTDGGQGFISIDAYESREESPPLYAGEIHDDGASWNNGAYWFTVWTKSEASIGRDGIVAIASALDPTFSAQCFLQTEQLTTAELGGLGFRSPNPPDGFEVTSSNLTIADVGPECDTRDPEVEASYSLSWTLETDDGDTIEASVRRMGNEPKRDASGFVWDFGMNWTDSNGDQYSVNGFPAGKTEEPLADEMQEVAMSLDPSLDVDSLQNEGAVDSVESPPRPVEAR